MIDLSGACLCVNMHMTAYDYLAKIHLYIVIVNSIENIL